MNRQKGFRRLELCSPTFFFFRSRKTVQSPNQSGKLHQNTISRCQLPSCAHQQFYKKEWMRSLNGDNNAQLSEIKSAADPKLNGAARVREPPLRKAQIRYAQDKSKCNGTSTTEAENKGSRQKLHKLHKKKKTLSSLNNT
uniref:Uncharacterized protein n=1 Tax=Glossina austeni TaxID=7395 RepID=A0A1A9VLT1_GLOAU